MILMVRLMSGGGGGGGGGGDGGETFVYFFERWLEKERYFR
jgi:hypothetical protein